MSVQAGPSSNDHPNTNKHTHHTAHFISVRLLPPRAAAAAVRATRARVSSCNFYMHMYESMNRPIFQSSPPIHPSNQPTNESPPPTYLDGPPPQQPQLRLAEKVRGRQGRRPRPRRVSRGREHGQVGGVERLGLGRVELPPEFLGRQDGVAGALVCHVSLRDKGGNGGV